MEKVGEGIEVGYMGVVTFAHFHCRFPPVILNDHLAFDEQVVGEIVVW